MDLPKISRWEGDFFKHNMHGACDFSSLFCAKLLILLMQVFPTCVPSASELSWATHPKAIDPFKGLQHVGDVPKVFCPN